MVGAQSGMPCGEPGMPMVSSPVRNGCSPEDEGRAARRAALLRVGIGEERALRRDAIDVRRLVAHHAEAVGADVVDADVVAPDDEDVRLLCRGVRRAALKVGPRKQPARLAANRWNLCRGMVPVLVGLCREMDLACLRDAQLRYSNAKIFFQSSFMLMTVQPFFFASS